MCLMVSNIGHYSKKDDNRGVRRCQNSEEILLRENGLYTQKTEKTDLMNLLGQSRSGKPVRNVLFAEDMKAGQHLLCIRVFPNMYPAVSASGFYSERESFYEQTVGTGRHEVLVDTSTHGETIDEFSLGHMQEVLMVLRMRYVSIRAEENTEYVQIFKNCGAEAGMSIQHSHWQLVGVPIVPERIRKMMDLGMGKSCRFCEMLLHEQEQKKRIAYENETFLAIAPYASRYPYEVWVMPKAHRKAFGELTAEEMSDLAEMLHVLLPKVAKLRQDVGYNLCLMDSPKFGDFHWHLQILPRIGGFAGFENATDCFINTVRPEDAAAYYRGDGEETEA